MQPAPRAARPGDVAPYEEIISALIAYCPSGIPPLVWDGVAFDAIPLIAQAGAQRKKRALCDAAAVASVVRYLLTAGAAVAFEEVLLETTRLAFDQEQKRRGVPPTSRAARRSILRRLAAARSEVPWRGDHREPGARPMKIFAPEVVDQIDDLVKVAAQASGGRGAAVIEAVMAVYNAPPGRMNEVRVNERRWRQATKFARAHGKPLTRQMLTAARTYGLLSQPQPLAILALRHRMTRRDLDLGLPLAARLPERPDLQQARLLRGI